MFFSGHSANVTCFVAGYQSLSFDFLFILLVVNKDYTSEQRKGRLLVVASFFIYFRCVLSQSETSSGNDYN